MRKVFITLTFMIHMSFSQSLFSDTAQKPVEPTEIDSYLDNLILPVSLSTISSKYPQVGTILKDCIEPLQRGDLEKAKKTAQSAMYLCYPYYFIAKEYHRIAFNKDKISIYYDYFKPAKDDYAFLVIKRSGLYNPYSFFYTVLIEARAAEKIGDTSIASEGYALLLASLRYGRYYFISQGLVPSDRTETLVPSVPPYNFWEEWLERKVKELGGERYYKRYLKRFHMEYYFILGTYGEDPRQIIASAVYGGGGDKIDRAVDAFIDRLLSLERELLQ